MVLFLRKYILPYVVYIVYRILSWTWRITYNEDPELKKMINSSVQSKQKNGFGFCLAFWHGDELALIHASKRYRIATMTSTSKDGELMDKVLRLLGGKTSRGSSTRGGVRALKGLLILMKSGYNAGMAVDGPKGPIHEVKPGVFEISRISQVPIFPGSVATNSMWRSDKSWNKTYLPKPFAQVIITWGNPMLPVDKKMNCRSEALAQELKTRIESAHQSSLKLIDAKFL